MNKAFQLWCSSNAMRCTCTFFFYAWQTFIHTYSTSSLVQTLKDVKFAFIINLCFHTFQILVTLNRCCQKENLWIVWIRPQKKKIQKKKKCSHYIIGASFFFKFKYLFSLFCITLICLWSRLLGNINGEGIKQRL